MTMTVTTDRAPDIALAQVALGQLRQHFRHLGLDLPAALAADLATIEAPVDTSGLHFEPIELVEAVTAALDAGKDPATDKAVRTLLARQQLARLNLNDRRHVDADRRRATALQRHTDSIIDALVPVVADAGRTLAGFADRFPDLDPTAPGAVAQSRADDLAAWGRAREAVDRTGRAFDVWQLVYRAGHFTPGTDEPALVLADLSAAQLDAIRGWQPAPHRVVQHGHRLDLATRESFAQRVERVRRERERTVGIAAVEARDGVRRDAAGNPDLRRAAR